MSDDPYTEIGYTKEKPYLVPHLVLNLDALNWHYDRHGRRIEKKEPRLRL